jgi:hypothetical protein
MLYAKLKMKTAVLNSIMFLILCLLLQNTDLQFYLCGSNYIAFLVIMSL